MRVFMAGLLTTFAFYTLIGIVCTMYFGADVQEMVTLNWLVRLLAVCLFVFGIACVLLVYCSV